MRNFPWVEVFLIIAMAVALIVRPQSKSAADTTQPAASASLPR